MELHFTKMEGIGNDYIYVDGIHQEVPMDAEFISRISNRHFGIGGDGMIVILKSDQYDFKMRMFNLDGSEGMMCGNGIRCVGKYVYDYGLTDKDEISVDTLAGIKYLKLTIENGKVSKVRVNMGKPILKASEIPVKAEKEPVVAEAIEAGGREWKMTCVSMGNPHAVIFIDTPVKEFPLETYGPLFESHERFPKRTNTEFVRVLDRKTMEMRVWERGSAETLACGTGTCATAVAAVLNGLCDRSVLVHLLGGDLEIEWNEEDGCVYMTGPATTVFDGEITLPEGLE